MSSSKPYKLPKVAIRMVKEPPLYSSEPVNRPSDAVRLVRELLQSYDREAVVIVNLDTRAKPINFNIVSVGTLNASLAHPREIMKSAVLSNAAYIVGMLAPQTGLNAADMPANEQEVDEDIAYGDDADYTAGEDDENEPISSAHFKTPSSIGISFYVASSCPSVNLEVSWGDYYKSSDIVVNREGEEKTKYEFAGVSAALEGVDKFYFSMRDLSFVKRKNDIIEKLNTLAAAYEKWIKESLVEDSKMGRIVCIGIE